MKKILLITIAALSLIAGYFYYADTYLLQREYPPRHLVGIDYTPVSSRPSTHALIVNGAWNKEMNHPRYWNNISLIYGALKKRGVEKITVLNSDGLDPEPDRSQRAILGVKSNGVFEDSPLDLDGDGTVDVHGDSTIESFRNALQQIGESMKPGDDFILVFTDHGQFRLNGGIETVALMWNNEDLYPQDFEKFLKEYIPKESWVAILAGQCHGGLFLKKMNRDKTLFIAPGWPLWIWSSQNYSEFIYYFAEALIGQDLITKGPLSLELKKLGFIEAFSYATERDSAPEWPIMWSQGNIEESPF